MSLPQARSSSEYSMESLTSTGAKRKVVNRKSDLKNRGLLYCRLLSSPGPCFAIIPSFVCGAAPIVSFLILAQILNEHAKWNADKSYNPLPAIKNWCLWTLLLAVIIGICKFLTIFSWIRIGSRFTMRLRDELFTAMMKDEVAFFDTTPIGTLLTLLSEDSQAVQEAFGSTKGTQIGNLAQFLSGLILCYVYSWKIGLVSTALIPFTVTIISTFSCCIDRHVIRMFKYISASMTIAEETIASIRTVRGFNREKMEIARFMAQTKKGERQNLWISLLVNIMFTLVVLLLWVLVCGNLYWGGTMVQEGTLPSGNLFAVFTCLLWGNFALIELQASMQAEQKAIASGGRIIALTRHVPELNFEGGDIIEDFKGHIEFKHVSFKYPSRDVYVLRDVSFEIKPGQMGALVGHSGSGKSTCVQLLERYYDVTDGVILLDGHDIRTLDPRWLHKVTALVSQEPILFQMTVKENIKYGKSDATDEEVEAAAEIANVKKFIMKMEHGFDQMVGEKGSTLSGGQRQRIAIARAVIRDPVILITDEATSALDAGSEKKVQMALDRVMENRTAVVVAHRLSTIKNADVIYVFDTGEIKEVGTHDELVALKGYYYELVRKQLTAGEVSALENGSDKEPVEEKATSSSSSSDE